MSKVKRLSTDEIADGLKKKLEKYDIEESRYCIDFVSEFPNFLGKILRSSVFAESFSNLVLVELYVDLELPKKTIAIVSFCFKGGKAEEFKIVIGDNKSKIECSVVSMDFSLIPLLLKHFREQDV